MSAAEPRTAAPGEWSPDLLAPLPPTSPGHPNGAAERAPADNWGPAVLVPSIADSPHWDEIGGAA